MRASKTSRTTPVGTPEPAGSIQWWALAIALGTLLLYLPVRQFQFVNYDDDVFVFTNEHVREGFTWAGIRWAFGSADIDYWRPLSWLSHMLDVELFGLAPGGHHLTSMFIHALNAALLCLALHALTGRVLASALVAALFAWHPLHIESVAWVAERKDVLCASFWFLGLMAYARHVKAPSRKRFAIVALCFVLGLMTKPMILTFPFLLLLLDIWPLRRVELPVGADWASLLSKLVPLAWEKALLFGMVVLASAGTYVAQRNVGAVMAEEIHPLVARLANVPVAYARYVGLTFWPVDLAVLHPLPPAWPAWQVGGALTLLAAISACCVNRLGREPWLFVGWCWFLGTLVPVIGVVQVGEQALANRYTYVPLIGLFVALVWGLEGWLARRPVALRWYLPGAFVILALCAFGTRRELRHWRTGMTLFEQAVRVTKDNFVALTNLGNNLARNGQHERAIELYRQSLRVRPSLGTTHYNLAIALAETRQPQAAEEHYREALRRQPNHAGAHHNLANLLAEQGRIPEALGHYTESLRLQPGNGEVRFNYGMALADLGRRRDAIEQFEMLTDRPAATRARLQLVTLYGAEGQLDAALKHNLALLQHDPESVHGQFNAGSLASLHGDWPTALRHWEETLRLKPDFLPALYRMTWTLATHPQATVRNPERAWTIAQQALQVAGPNNVEFLDAFAAAAAAAGKFDLAMTHASRALAAVGTNTAASAEIRSRLALYASGKPFVEPPVK